jgi:outer membrane protein
MEKFYKVITGILLVAVVVLYYLFFSSGVKTQSGSSVKIGSNKIKAETSLRLAYIDLDTIEEKYLYFKQKNDELEKEKKKMETEVESGVKKLELDRENFLKRGQSITQAEAEQFQQQFQVRYQQLSEKRERLFAAHMENQKKAFDEIQAKINDYLNEYNKNEKYQFIFSVGAGNLTVYYKDSALNITTEVLKGLNASYQKKGK